MRSVFGLCAALLFGGPAFAASAPFSDANLGFSATFPAAPAREDTSEDGVPTTSLEVMANGDYFAVSVTWFGDALAGSATQDLLKATVDEVVEDAEAEVVSNTEITIDGVPARDLVATTETSDGPARVHSKVALKDGTLYHAIAVDGGERNEAEVRAFLDSFRIKR